MSELNSVSREEFEKLLDLRLNMLREIEENMETLTSEEIEEGGSYIADLRQKERINASAYRYSIRNIRALNLLEIRSKARILDCGSGIGSESLLFAMKGADVVACEVRKEAISVAEKRYAKYENRITEGTIRFRNTAVANILLDEKFDIIYLQEAISHIHPAEQFLEMSIEALNPGGVLYITDTNSLSPIARLGLIKRDRRFRYVVIKVFDHEKGAEIEYAGERLFSSRKVKRILRKLGYQDIQVYQYGFLPILRIKRTGHCYCYFVIENLISKIPIINSLSLGYVIIASRKNKMAHDGYVNCE